VNAVHVSAQVRLVGAEVAVSRRMTAIHYCTIAAALIWLDAALILILAGPALATVGWITARRWSAPLARGVLERWSTLAATAFAAAFTCALLWSWFTETTQGQPIRSWVWRELAWALALCLPPVAASVACATGELLSGPSLRWKRAFAAAALVAQGASVAIAATSLTDEAPLGCGIIAVGGPLLASLVYLLGRGPASIDRYSSSMREKRSLLGCSGSFLPGAAVAAAGCCGCVCGAGWEGRADCCGAGRRVGAGSLS
jgi:hypothetical protein